MSLPMFRGSLKAFWVIVVALGHTESPRPASPSRAIRYFIVTHLPRQRRRVGFWIFWCWIFNEIQWKGISDSMQRGSLSVLWLAFGFQGWAKSNVENYLTFQHTLQMLSSGQAVGGEMGLMVTIGAADERAAIQLEMSMCLWKRCDEK